MEPDASRNESRDELFQRLRGYGARCALVNEEGSITSFAELIGQVAEFSTCFSAGRGLLLLECNNSRECIVAYLAALRSGCPVSLVGDLHPEDTARLKSKLSFRYHYSPVRQEFLVHPEHREIAFHEDLAVLLSTSGSTAEAKNVKLSWSNLRCNANAIISYLEIGADDRAPTNLPFHYSYGMSIANSHLFAGASLVLTERSVIDRRFWQVFDETRCTSFAGVPHTYELMDRNRIVTANLRSLRYATQAGGRLAPERVANWAARAEGEGWRFFVMYGQTEAAPRMAYLPPHLARDHPDSVGIAVPGGCFELVDENGAEISATDQVGELVYRGPNVMMGYATVDADLAGGPAVGALHTGDIARRDEKGLYYIVGRKNRFIKPFGLRISLDAVEQKLAEAGIEAVCAGRAEELWVLTVGAQDTPAVVANLPDWLGIPADVIHHRAIGEFPRRENGKIDFVQVNARVDGMSAARAAGNQNGDKPSVFARLRGTLSGSHGSRCAADVFRNHFPNRTISADASFTSLGGDSLGYISVSLDLEALLGELPQGWENLTVSELEQTSRTTPKFVRMEMATVLRCLAIVMVVSGHLDFVDIGGGGAYLLFLVAGVNFAKYQLGSILVSQSVRAVWSLIAKVALPTIAYLVLLGLVFHALDWRTLALVSNWYDPNINRGFAAWFIEVYVQILLMMALLLSIKAVRVLGKASLFGLAMALTIGSILIYVAGHALWDAHELYGRLPHLLIWLFAFGLAASVAGDIKQKLLIAVLWLIQCWLFFDGFAQGPFTEIGGLLAIFNLPLRVPAVLRRAISEIAGASLIIYLTHFQFGSLVDRIAPVDPGIHVLVALIGGVIVYRWYQASANWIFANMRQLPSYRFNTR